MKNNSLLARLPIPPATLLRVALGGLAVAVLVVGALLVTATGDAEPYEDADTYVAGFYANSDVGGMLEAFAPETVNQARMGQASAALGQILRPEISVQDTRVADVAGVPITEVATDDGLRWCVRPDGRILVDCRLGTMPVDVTTATDTLEVTDATADVLLEGGRISVALTNAGDAPFVFDGGLDLTGAEGADIGFEPRDSVMVAGDRPQPAPLDRTIELPPTGTLYLSYLLEEEPWRGEDGFTLAWDSGSVDLDFGNIDWHLR